MTARGPDARRKEKKGEVSLTTYRLVNLYGRIYLNDLQVYNQHARIWTRERRATENSPLSVLLTDPCLQPTSPSSTRIKSDDNPHLHRHPPNTLYNHVL